MNKQGLFKLYKRIFRGEQIIAALLFFVFFLFVAYTLFDVQRAQGVGLYLSIQAGKSHSLLWDALACGIFLIPFIILLMLPCLGMQRKDAFSLLRFQGLYLTFVPSVSSAYLIHLPKASMPFALREALVQGEWQTLFTDFVLFFLPYLRTALPLLCLLIALQAHKKASLPRWVKMLFIIQPVLLMVGFLFIKLTPLSEYLIWYLLILTLYRLWEDTPGENTSLHTANWLLTLFLLITGCYRLLALLSSFSLS